MEGSDNIDAETVSGFGMEWTKYDQSEVPTAELQGYFASYFKVFPWDAVGPNATGFDLGCGSGRWAKFVAPRVGVLHCIDASADALESAKRNLRELSNCTFECASVDTMSVPDDSMDFGYSLGVLHHVPDTLKGLRSCVEKLKIGAPFLVYLYYRFDNKPGWYRTLWEASNRMRLVISRLPHQQRARITSLLAAVVYWPLARSALVADRLGFDISTFPLSAYRAASFYTMRTDALDRFGTALEQRFTREEIADMMVRAGLSRLTFSDEVPFWCAVGYRDH